MNKKKLSKIHNLIKKNQYSIAQEKIIELIDEEPSNLSYKNLLAIIYVNQNKIKDSIIVLKNIIKQFPNFIDAHINLGNIYVELRELSKAKDCFKQATTINPAHSIALYNLANVYDKQYKYNKSLKIYSKLILKDPHNLELLNSYSSTHIKIGNLDKAKKILNKILKLNPKYTNAIINVGIIYKKKNNLKQAIKYFTLAIKIEPNLAVAYYNLGIIYENMDKLYDAVYYFNKAIIKKSKYIEAHYNLGCVLDKIGRIKEAILHYQKVLNYDSNHFKAQYNLSRDQLSIDDFHNGWIGFELRYKQGAGTKEVINYEILGIQKEKIWNGKKFKGTLIVHAEQGIGDEILFSSMFPDLLKHHDKIFISVDKRLKNLCERSFPTISFIDRKKKFIVEQDSKHILAGSLGKFLRNSLKDFKSNQIPWLMCSQKKYTIIKNKIPVSKKIKVGISWKSPAYIDKNISLKKLLSILPDKYFDIINLQYGNTENERKKTEELQSRKIIYFNNFDYKNDQEGLAAIINNCDFVVSVSNAVVHLSGALGKLTYTLIPTRSLWYWHNERNNCLWYPNVLLFKQSTWRKWDEPLARIKNDIELKYIKNYNYLDR